MDDRRRRVRDRDAVEFDLRLWRNVREAWLRIEETAVEFQDTKRADLARGEVAAADAAIERLREELEHTGMRPGS
jgi:hypothetical protein